MSITLNTEQEQIIANLIATGSFQTADEVLQVALELLERERESYRSWIEQTRELVTEGIASLDRGEGIDGETVVNNLLAKLRSDLCGCQIYYNASHGIGRTSIFNCCFDTFFTFLNGNIRQADYGNPRQAIGDIYFYPDFDGINPDNCRTPNPS